LNTLAHLRVEQPLEPGKTGFPPGLSQASVTALILSHRSSASFFGRMILCPPPAPNRGCGMQHTIPRRHRDSTGTKRRLAPPPDHRESVLCHSLPGDAISAKPDILTGWVPCQKFHFKEKKRGGGWGEKELILRERSTARCSGRCGC